MTLQTATVPPESVPRRRRPIPPERGVSVVAAVIVLTLLWYLLADRYTPYTQQARVQALIVPVAAEVSGQVTQVHVHNNQTVEAGQDLFEIDPEPFQIAVERARADLEATRRQIGASTAGIDSAVASLRAAASQRTAKSAGPRPTRASVSRRPRHHLTAPPGNLPRRPSNRPSPRLRPPKRTCSGPASRKAAAAKTMRSCAAQRPRSTKAELDLANTRIRASSAGLVTDLRTEVGQFAAAGKPVLTLITIDDVWISAELTENNLGHVRPGTPVRIVLDALPGRVFEGRVRSIGYGVSVGSETPPGSLPTAQNNRDWLRAAQRFPVIIEFERGQLDEPRALRIGGQAEVMAFPSDGNPLNLLGRMFLRVMSWLSFAY